MDELHEAAIAYYNNGSKEQQNLSWQFFRAMDVNGDGRVSLQEYTDFLRQTAGFSWVKPDMFRELDRNGDGQLDFWEVLTLYYVARTRTISCCTCLRSLNGLYFTCVACFESPCGATFDLCVTCYMRRTYCHPHRLFLDSFVLLRSRRNHHPLQLPPPPPPCDQNLVQQQPSKIGWWTALSAMEAAIFGAHVAGFCTIM